MGIVTHRHTIVTPTGSLPGISAPDGGRKNRAGGQTFDISPGAGWDSQLWLGVIDNGIYFQASVHVRGKNEAHTELVRQLHRRARRPAAGEGLSQQTGHKIACQLAGDTGGAGARKVSTCSRTSKTSAVGARRRLAAISTRPSSTLSKCPSDTET